MRINGLTTCVGYADLFRQSILGWKSGLDEMLVLTNYGDNETIQLCRDSRVSYYMTDAFYTKGAWFNRAAAMQEAIDFVYPLYPLHIDWILFFDPDIIPPAGWRDMLTTASPRRMNGAWRYDTKGQKIPDAKIGFGYFQLFNYSDPVVQDTPLLDTSWKHAGGHDESLLNRWKEPAIELPLHLVHVGETGNWLGRGKRAEYEAMMERRKISGTIGDEERLK